MLHVYYNYIGLAGGKNCLLKNLLDIFMGEILEFKCGAVLLWSSAATDNLKGILPFKH